MRTKLLFSLRMPSSLSISKKRVRKLLPREKKNVVASRIPDRDAILKSIKEFLGTGR